MMMNDGKLWWLVLIIIVTVIIVVNFLLFAHWSLDHREDRRVHSLCCHLQDTIGIPPNCNIKDPFRIIALKSWTQASANMPEALHKWGSLKPKDICRKRRTPAVSSWYTSCINDLIWIWNFFISDKYYYYFTITHYAQEQYIVNV